MALFSQRFWMQLSALDARVVSTQRAHQAASSRMLVGRRLVTGASLVDYWIDLTHTTRGAEQALAELNHFCTGRSKALVHSAPVRSSLDHMPELRANAPDPSLAIG